MSTLAKSNLATTDSIMLGLQSPWPNWDSVLDEAPQAPVILGDARLKLHDAKDGGYDLLVLDAFSGDSIPMHLMTREALALYLRKVAPGGMLAFHISSLYLQLAPTLGARAVRNF